MNFPKKQLTKLVRFHYTIILKVSANLTAFSALPDPKGCKFRQRPTLCVWKKEGIRWNGHISPRNCIDRKFTASAREWPAPMAGRSWREDAIKAERDCLTKKELFGSARSCIPQKSSGGHASFRRHGFLCFLALKQKNVCWNQVCNGRKKSAGSKRPVSHKRLPSNAQAQ